MRLFGEMLSGADGGGIAFSGAKAGILGGRRAALENRHAIFAYTAGEVVFETSRGRVRVAGEDLRIARYGEGDALVEGKVRLVELLEGEA